MEDDRKEVQTILFFLKIYIFYISCLLFVSRVILFWTMKSKICLFCCAFVGNRTCVFRLILNTQAPNSTQYCCSDDTTSIGNRKLKLSKSFSLFSSIIIGSRNLVNYEASKFWIFLVLYLQTLCYLYWYSKEDPTFTQIARIPQSLETVQ